MLNWTDDEGFNWYNVLECKRCCQRFEADSGEVPIHECHGEKYTSVSLNGEWHIPLKVK